MKFLLITCFILIAAKSFSQEQIGSKTPDNLKYSAEDSIVTDAENGILKLYGNAKIQIDKVAIKADNIFCDRKNRQITATGLQSYSFPFKLNSSLLNRKNVLKYTLGSDTVFID